MMKYLHRLVCALIVATAGALAALPAQAHHSFAMFDMNKSVTAHGTVKQFQWTNPHSWLQLLVKNPQGSEEEWSLELGPLVGLHRAGWKPHSLQPGDKVMVSFHPLRDGSHGGRLITVTLPNGEVLNGQGGAADAAEANRPGS